MRKADELMMHIVDDSEWNQLSLGEKKKQLYLKQVKTLNNFLERNAITKAEYEKSLGDLTMKMGMSDLREDYDGAK